MVRVNAVGTGFEQSDLESVLPTKHIQALALPKTTIADHMRHLVDQIEKLAPESKRRGRKEALRVIAMIENARGMMNLREIIEAGQGYIDGLLVSRIFAGLMAVRRGRLYVHRIPGGTARSRGSLLDCADVGIIRTPSRMEMLFARSQIVTAAKAYGLQAIDLVSLTHKDGADS